MNSRAIRAVAVASALSFVLAACGQKPGVHIEGSSGGLAAGAGGQSGSLDAGAEEGGLDTGTGDVTGGETTGGDPATSGLAGGDAGGGTTDGTGGTTGGGSTGGGSTDGSGGSGGTGGSGGDTGGSGGGSGDGGGGEQQGQFTPKGTDQTGVSDDKIVLGLHAPVTGAAPLPTTSFEKSGDLYWKHVTQNGGTVLGRKEVQLLFRDDKYSPDSARQICRELADKAFTLAGGGGTDQIQACGQLAAREKYPYFSAGVTEAGLEGNEWYFASSMSYRQQGLLLANYIAKNLPQGKIGAIFTNTPNFDDAIAGWNEGIKKYNLGSRIVENHPYRHPKGDTSWYDAVAKDFKNKGVEIVYILSSPVDYIQFAQTADDSYGYNPQYVGVGVSMGLNAVLGSGCDGTKKTRAHGGIWLSPFPGLDWARSNVKAFFDTAKKHNAPADDIALALWGSNAVTHQLFQRYGELFGTKLTREDFRLAVENQTGVETGVFPTLNYSPDNHFGASTAHVIQADCTKGEHVTLKTFASSF